MAAFNSRMARVEERRNMRKVTWIALGSILIVVGMITLGIPALVRMVAYIGESKGGGTGDKNDLIPPAPPSIYLPWNATNSAVQKITGASEPGSQVILTVNDKTIGSINAADDGSFNFDNVILTDGQNSLVAVAIDGAGNKSQSSVKSEITYVKKELKLTIDTPTDKQNFSGNESIDLKGQVDSGSKLTVNGRFIMIDKDGNFNTKWTLNEGETKLTFVASDFAGNQTQKELTVTFTR